MVIDASVGVKLVVPEADAAKAIDLVETNAILVPNLFYIEVANALWKKARRKELELAPVLPFLAELPRLMETAGEGAHVPRAISIAADLDHPIYDCIYLALAEERGALLVTADTKFLRRIMGTQFAAMVVAL